MTSRSTDRPGRSDAVAASSDITARSDAATSRSDAVGADNAETQPRNCTYRNRTPAEKLAFVDAALAVAGHEITDPVMRDLLERVIRNEITADQAMAVARHYVQD